MYTLLNCNILYCNLTETLHNCQYQFKLLPCPS